MRTQAIPTTTRSRRSSRPTKARGGTQSDPVTAYAHEVVSGAKPAGRWHRASCARHLADLERAQAGAFPYEWRPDLAAKFFTFCRLLRHYKGEWGGQRIVLEPWQQFVLGSVLGWVQRGTRWRRFRNSFVELPRGQGKSTMAGALLVYLTFFDGEPGADGFVVATKKDQAKIVFGAARQMVLRSPAIKKFVTAKRYNLHAEASESHAEPLGANEDTLDGLRPHVVIADEVHKQATPELIGVVQDGMGTRRHPHLYEITTAGIDDDTTVYGQHYRLSAQVLDGSLDVPEWFAFIAHADPDDDPWAEATWRKANPNYGVSVKPEHLAKMAKIAKANPAAQSSFRRVYLGQKVEDREESYFSREHWDQCPALPSDEELRAAPCWMGVDLSSSVDLTAAALVWRLERPGGPVLAVQPRFWVPEANLEARRARDRVPYDAWAAQGHLELTEGNTIDRATVRRGLVAWAAEWTLQGIAYDPWHAGEMTQAMQDEDGLLMVPVAQQFSKLSEPTKRLQALILEHGIAHGQHPILRWMIGNARVRSDDKENVLLCKKRSRARIDGLAAIVTALSQMQVAAEPVYVW